MEGPWRSRILEIVLLDPVSGQRSTRKAVYYTALQITIHGYYFFIRGVYAYYVLTQILLCVIPFALLG